MRGRERAVLRACRRTSATCRATRASRPRRRRAGARSEAPPPARVQLRGRDRRRARDRGGDLPRVRGTDPILGLAVRAQGRVHERDRAAHSLAGADRRRGCRRGHLGHAARGQLAGRRGHDGHQQQRTADPRRRDRRDPVADLPRGELLRRPASGLAERSDPQLGRDAAGPPDGGTGAARSRAVGADHRLAVEPPGARAGPRRFAQRSAERRPGRRPEPGPERPRADRRPGAEQVAASTRPARSRRTRSSTRRCSAPSRTT